MKKQINSGRLKLVCPWVLAVWVASAWVSKAGAGITAGEIERLAQPYVDAGEVVGMTIGVIHGVDQAVAGVGSFGKQDPRVPGGDTVYEIGSFTKVLTGLLLADSVTQGGLKLQMPLGELGVETSSDTVSGITLLQLSTHTSGLPRLPQNLKIIDPTNPYAAYTQADLIDCMKRVQLDHAPGSATAYSNLGTGLLGELLGQEAAMSYEALLDERVLQPLGMGDSSVQMRAGMRERAAAPHAAGGVPSHHWDFPVLAGAGGVKSTVNDLMRLVDASIHPDKAGELKNAIELAWQIHQPSLKEGGMANGLGWFVAQDGKTRWHNGETGGFHSIVLVNRALKIGVVILANTATAEVETLANDLFKAALGIPVEPRVFEKKVEVPVRVMDRLVGEYKIGNRFTFNVTRQGAQLLVQLTGQPPLVVIPESPTLWRYRDIDDAAIRFDVDAKGRVKSLTLLQHGIEQKAMRQ